MKKLGIVVAMEVEAMLLIKKLELKEVDKTNKIYEMDNEDQIIKLIISGIGMENSAIATQILIQKYNLEEILNFGYAGSNKIKIGTVVSPDIVYNNDFDLTCMGYEKYKIPGVSDLKLNEISTYVNCPCYTANHFVTESREENLAIYDMELHGIAMVCYKNIIKLTSIKIITDCLDANKYNKNETDESFVEILTNAAQQYINK